MDFELGKVMGYTGPQELKENSEILPGCLRVVTPLPRICPVSLKIRGIYGAYTGHIRGIYGASTGHPAHSHAAGMAIQGPFHGLRMTYSGHIGRKAGGPG
jgi:hypothetical protein